MKTTGSKKIAERYVSALFDTAQGAKATDAVEKDMLALQSALAQTTDFQEFLGNPLLSREAQGKAMEALLAKLGANKVTAQFIALLAGQKRLPILPQIIELFLEFAAAARGELAAELVSALPFPKAEAQKVADKLSKAYNRKINLSLRVDPALIGGAIINIGSVQLDASLAGKLNRLKAAMKAA